MLTISPPYVRPTHAGSELEGFTVPSPDDARLGSSPDFQRICNNGGKCCTDREPSWTSLTSHWTTTGRASSNLGDIRQYRAFPSDGRVRPEADPTIVERASRLGPNPTGTNQKQFLVVRKILSQHHRKPALDSEYQMFLERDVGKTRVIKAMELGFELQRRKDILALTSTVAYNITPPSASTCATYSLYQGRTLFIDEISMVSLTMLNTINQQCNRIRAVGQDSTSPLPSSVLSPSSSFSWKTSTSSQRPNRSSNLG